MHPFTFIFFGVLASALPLSTGVSPDSKTVAHSGVDINARAHYARNHMPLYEHYKNGKADDTNQATAPKIADSNTHSVQNTHGHHSIEVRQGLNPYLIAEKSTQSQYVSDRKEKQDSQNREEKKHSQN
ncbi:hypothetical protein V8F33_012115 [Rhypophila sp. PSN 637]